MSRVLFLLFFAVIYLTVDYYVFQTVRQITEANTLSRKIWYAVYWGLTITAILGVFLYRMLDPEENKSLRLFLTTFFFINVVSKLFVALFLLVDDFRRLVVWLSGYFGRR